MGKLPIPWASTQRDHAWLTGASDALFSVYVYFQVVRRSPHVTFNFLVVEIFQITFVSVILFVFDMFVRFATLWYFDFDCLILILWFFVILFFWFLISLNLIFLIWLLWFLTIYVPIFLSIYLNMFTPAAGTSLSCCAYLTFATIVWF